ncbi:MAG: glycoside hydrolase family 3 C-terminal domain-containing protein [Xylanivirga thermophila]|jgi:beta-glucosidase|uniref:glycoside hydrolase family 3 C-terminal domain-containing protein n=1 Tax=Xylanivirga thermophila TaxID=2496273 RepID=UPI0039F5C1F7
MKGDFKGIIKEMTLEEKASLCSGLDFWHTKCIKRLNVPSIMMADGPHGLRKQADETDHLGLNVSVPATCFPSGATLACSWDRSLLEKVGEALGEECQAQGVSILLGPAVNIKRSPLCGRNFEYFSEDPYLSSELAASHIKGVQSQGVGTSLKHFTANNQEHKRLIIDAKIDERTLREIYLSSFEGTVKQAKPWTVMCAYNKVNGKYCSENRYLLTDILREEWGYEGFVVSDWGAVNDRVDALISGLELEMPSSGGTGDRKIIDAVKKGVLSESVLDEAVERLLRIIFKAIDNKREGATYDEDVHHQLAREVARECMVLLKNEDEILPLKKEGTLAVIGSFAKYPRYQGGGSSHVNPTRVDSALGEIKKLAGANMGVLYADGYRLDGESGLFSGKAFSSNSDIVDETLIKEAKEIAQKADVAVVFAGLPESYESEAFDRRHIRIPEGHRQLIEEVAEVNKNIIVILSNGSPIEMPWLDRVKGVLEGYLGGQAFGGAVADLLFGIANPCGKLAETFPVKLSDNPSYLNFPGDGTKVEYREGLFVGYRYYEAKKMETLFPFGYGLSYTSFDYTDIWIDRDSILDTEELTVNIKIKNTGSVTGKEIVQLYVKDIESSVVRPIKELKGFEKISLKPGEEKTVTFTLGKRAFAYYNEDIKDWYVEDGEFEILVGGSSRCTPLKAVVYISSTEKIKKIYTRNSTVEDIMASPKGQKILEEFIKDSPLGISDGQISSGMAEMIKGMPLRNIVMFSNGQFTDDMLNILLKELNQ